MRIFRLKLMKLVSPDFYLGKILVGVKAMLDLAWLLAKEPTKKNLRFARLIVSVKPKFTMVKNENLKLLYDLVDNAHRTQVHGDIVECGVWNGGSAAIMGVAGMDVGLQKDLRTIWLFDSFQGLPRPGEKDGAREKDYYFTGWNTGSVRLVNEIFKKIGYPNEKIRVVPGWFNETIACAPIKDVAILHIDADWYESVKIVLDMLYDRVVPGGFVVLDDYGLWPGCRRAVLDYFSEHDISETIVRGIGKQGAYFQKPS
jgi:O-methyltransferase